MALGSSLPFVGLGSYYIVLAYQESRWPVDAMYLFWKGTFIFLLGSPLTLIYTLLMPYIGSFLRWGIGNELGFLVVPVYVLLFWCQWIIWSQLIVLIYRKFVRSNN